MGRAEEHQVGEELVFRVSRGSEPPRDIQVRHVSDYPPGQAPSARQEFEKDLRWPPPSLLRG